MYNHENQFRCQIIRGKALRDMDDLLPAYARVLSDICPCRKEDFANKFNEAFTCILKARGKDADIKKKTLDNHRTEISGKLFGMYYETDDGLIHLSERVRKLLEDNDQPAFFKDLCYKMQFPSGFSKCNEVVNRIEHGISVRPNSYVLRILELAQQNNLKLSKKDIGYYVLNSLDVLSRRATPEEVIEVIKRDKALEINREVGSENENETDSHKHQHINEQINYLVLANLLILDNGGKVTLNSKESAAIRIFAEKWNAVPDFDVSAYDFKVLAQRKQFELDWGAYYAKLSTHAGDFETSIEALIPEMPQQEKTDSEQKEAKGGENMVAFGDEGERLVYEYEKARVRAYKPRLAKKVISMGKIKGTGYDIQSVVAEPGEREEFVQYIEVKSTKRVTSPSIKDIQNKDFFTITRNEWVAAMQHRGSYSIYRVYFTNSGITVFVLKDIIGKSEKGLMNITPVIYKVDNIQSTAIEKSFAIK